jgi:hypothetical protein
VVFGESKEMPREKETKKCSKYAASICEKNRDHYALVMITPVVKTLCASGRYRMKEQSRIAGGEFDAPRS